MLASVVYQNGTASFSYDGTASSETISMVPNPLPPDRVDMFNLDIIWQVSINGSWNDDDNWDDIVMTMNRIYVTWRTPKAEGPYPPISYTSGYDHRETIFHIGCKFAKGMTTKEKQYRE